MLVWPPFSVLLKAGGIVAQHPPLVKVNGHLFSRGADSVPIVRLLAGQAGLPLLTERGNPATIRPPAMADREFAIIPRIV
jgi:hypothetical protein